MSATHKHKARRCIRVALLFFVSLAVASIAWAEEKKAATDTEALAKASQNPVSSLISLPFENNATFNNGPDNVFVNVLNIKPVIPMGLTENWNWINRAIIPVVYQDDGFMGQKHIEGASIGQPATDFTTQPEGLGSIFGLGDITYQGFLTPKKVGKLIWCFGTQINFPTGMDRLTSNQWSAGPAGVVLTMPGHWVVGGLVTNVWNIGNGYDDAPDVNQMMIQPFVNYNMDKGWYVSFSPVMTANWEADSGDQWTVPLGAGVGRVFKTGRFFLSALLSLCVALIAANSWAQDKVTPAEARKIAKEAYIFNYPLVMYYRTMYLQAIDTKSKFYSGGFGKWLPWHVHAQRY